MKTTRSLMTAVLASTLLIAGAGLSTAHASPHGHRHGEGGMMNPGRGMERMFDTADVSAEQRTQIRAIADAARADMHAQREAGRGLHMKMRELFVQPNVDANAVESLRQQMLAQHDSRSQRMTQAMVEISRVLTPEQRAQIAERKQQRGEMKQRHMRERRSLEQPKS